MQVIRTFFVEDRLGLLDPVVGLLENQSWIKNIGYSLTYPPPMKERILRRADLILMDWEDPAMTGLRALIVIKSLPKPPRVIVLSGHDHPHFCAAVKAAGADGVLLRSKFHCSLLPLIRELFPGYQCCNHTAFIPTNGEDVS